MTIVLELKLKTCKRIRQWHFPKKFLKLLGAATLKNTSGYDLSAYFSYLHDILKSSRPEAFCKKRVLENFVKITG